MNVLEGLLISPAPLLHAMLSHVLYGCEQCGCLSSMINSESKCLICGAYLDVTTARKFYAYEVSKESPNRIMKDKHVHVHKTISMN